MRQTSKNYFRNMICNETNEQTLFGNGISRRTHSSIRCSRQTQRTQLEYEANKRVQQQYIRQRCHTISEDGTSIDQSFINENTEHCDVSDKAAPGIFYRGTAQLRDSRRKTAEKWQIRKHSEANDENFIEEIRHGRKVQFLPAIGNYQPFLQNPQNSGTGCYQISTHKYPEFIRSYRLPSIFPTSTIARKSKNHNFGSNSNFPNHSDSSYLNSFYLKPCEMHLKSLGLHQTHLNIPPLNNNPLNEQVS